MTQFTVPNNDWFDLARCVSSGQVFRWEFIREGVWLGVEGENCYLAHLKADGSTQVETNGTQEDFESLFRLDWNGEEIETKLLQLGPELEPYLGALRGLRLMRPSSASETAVSFLCTSNNHIKRIGAMVGKLAAFGEPLVQLEGRELFRFPNLQTVGAIPEQQLREMGFGYRGATINRAAAEMAVRGGEVYLQSLKSKPLEQVRAELIALPGVGRKLADCIALFALDRVEVVPIDTHIWHALTRLYFPEYIDLPVTERRYAEISDFFRKRFGSLAGWAQQALFFDRVLNWRKP